MSVFSADFVGRMDAVTVANLLTEMIPEQHAAGRDHYVEALSEAAEAIVWQHLRTAPRDGTWVLIAVAPKPQHGLQGYVAFARWVVPDEDEPLGQSKRDRLAVSGGWWSMSHKGNKPLRNRKVVAWRPIPAFDFEPPAPEPANDAIHAQEVA